MWNLQAKRKELTSDASKSGSALDSDKAEKKAERERSGKWGAKAAAVEVISQIPWPALSCLSACSTVVLCPK